MFSIKIVTILTILQKPSVAHPLLLGRIAIVVIIFGVSIVVVILVVVVVVIVGVASFR